VAQLVLIEAIPVECLILWIVLIHPDVPSEIAATADVRLSSVPGVDGNPVIDVISEIEDVG
jgi:hypothetical protein